MSVSLGIWQAWYLTQLVCSPEETLCSLPSKHCPGRTPHVQLESAPFSRSSRSSFITEQDKCRLSIAVNPNGELCLVSPRSTNTISSLRIFCITLLWRGKTKSSGQALRHYRRLSVWPSISGWDPTNHGKIIHCSTNTLLQLSMEKIPFQPRNPQALWSSPTHNYLKGKLVPMP